MNLIEGKYLTAGSKNTPSKVNKKEMNKDNQVNYILVVVIVCQFSSFLLLSVSIYEDDNAVGRHTTSEL